MALSSAPVLDAFFGPLAQAAQQSNITTIAVLAQDPVTGAYRMIATAGAAIELRKFAAEKFKLQDPDVCEVEWA